MILAELDLEEWLREQGLGQYIPSVLRHTRTGAQLASLSVQDLEEVGGAGEGWEDRTCYCLRSCV